MAAYEHWLKCRATGRFPDDPIVARNAAVIQAVTDAFERQAARQISPIQISGMNPRRASHGDRP